MQITLDALEKEFISLMPSQSAKIIMREPLDTIVALLLSLDKSVAANMLQSFPNPLAAKVLEKLPAEFSAQLLSQYTADFAALVLRLVTKSARQNIISEMPRKISKQVTSFLSYTVEQVGAWADPNVPCVSSETTVAAAFDLFKNLEIPYASTEWIYVVDRNELLGRLSYEKLFTLTPTSTVHSACVQIKRPIRANLSLHHAFEGYQPTSKAQLPVVDSDEKFIGALGVDILVTKTKMLGMHNEKIQRADLTLLDLYGRTLLNLFGNLRSD